MKIDGIPFPCALNLDPHAHLVPLGHTVKEAYKKTPGRGSSKKAKVPTLFCLSYLNPDLIGSKYAISPSYLILHVSMRKNLFFYMEALFIRQINRWISSSF